MKTNKNMLHNFILQYRRFRKHYENPQWKKNMSNITSKFGSGISSVYHMQRWLTNLNLLSFLPFLVFTELDKTRLIGSFSMLFRKMDRPNAVCTINHLHSLLVQKRMLQILIA